jgi:hypothetical protein
MFYYGCENAPGMCPPLAFSLNIIAPGKLKAEDFRQIAP